MIFYLRWVPYACFFQKLKTLLYETVGILVEDGGGGSRKCVTGDVFPTKMFRQEIKAGEGDRERRKNFFQDPRGKPSIPPPKKSELGKIADS